MATIKQLIDKHNELAFQLGEPELKDWKRAKDVLEGRIQGMQDELDIKAEEAAERQTARAAAADPLAMDEDAPSDDQGEAQDPLAMDEDESEAPAAEEPQAKPKAEKRKRVEQAARAAKEGPTVGQTIERLLLDPAGLDYGAIVNRVLAEHPDANTSTRSVASVAATLRKKGVDVPMRRRGRPGEQS